MSKIYVSERKLLGLKEEYGHYSAGDYKGYKRLSFEGGHRVVTFIYWKGVIKPCTVDNPISQVDFYATFAD